MLYPMDNKTQKAALSFRLFRAYVIERSGERYAASGSAVFLCVAAPGCLAIGYPRHRTSCLLFSKVWPTVAAPSFRLHHRPGA